MMQLRKTVLPLLFLLATPRCLLLAQGRSANADMGAIAQKMGALYRGESSVGEMEMQIIRPQGERMLRLKVWTKGMDTSFIRIISPATEGGAAVLRLGSETWNYLPNTNTAVKILPAMMMNSWMDSDVTYGDLVNEFSWREDFHSKLLIPPEIGVNQLYVSFIPKEGRPIVWGEIITAVRREDYLPLWEKYYDKQHNFVRMLNYNDFKVFGNRTIPATMELIPQNREGRKTVLRFLTLEFDQAIDEEIFKRKESSKLSVGDQ